MYLKLCRFVLVYDDDVVKVTKMKMCSLIPRKLIVVGVVDAWASNLNNMEIAFAMCVLEAIK